jgi:hypothetical protein
MPLLDLPGRLPVGLDVVLAAEQIVVAPRRMHDRGVDPELVARIRLQRREVHSLLVQAAGIAYDWTDDR